MRAYYFFKLIALIAAMPAKRTIWSLLHLFLLPKRRLSLYEVTLRAKQVDLILDCQNHPLTLLSKKAQLQISSASNLLGCKSARYKMDRLTFEPDSRMPKHLKQQGKFRLFSSEFFRPIGHQTFIVNLMQAQQIGLISEKRNLITSNLDEFDCKPLIKLIQNSFSLPIITNSSKNFTYYDYERLGLIELANGELVSPVQMQCILQKTIERKELASPLKLSSELQEAGKTFLSKLPSKDFSWFITLHIRNSRGGLRDARNAKLINYKAAIKEIGERGGAVIRIGNAEQIKEEDINCDNYFDYERLKKSSNVRQDLDLFFLSECKFMIGTGSGPSAVPLLFGTPVLFTNWAPLTEVIGDNRSLWLPKHLKELQSPYKYLSLENRLEYFGSLESNSGANYYGLEFIDNSTEEILAAVIEMFEQVDADEPVSKYCNELETEFYKSLELKRIYPLKLSTIFSRQYF